VPLLAALDPAEQAEFLAEYAQGLAVAYPPAAGGRTLFPFRRLFIVANR
jgi:trans-aconitate 2-methyltransferase